MSLIRPLKDFDHEIFSAIYAESKRQEDGLELIASENSVSTAVLEAQGSVLTNKYAEGYPSKRYYGGCTFVDRVETLAQERVCKLFGAPWANVQPHSGSQANMAAYMALIKPGDKMMGMSLSHGGHLTHGSPVNFSGKLYHVIPYSIHPETHRIDFDAVRELALKERPRMIVAGASAYPRVIDFAKFAEIADEIGAHLVVDMAHIAGLVATGLHPSPIPFATYTTSTTHKTLRGPRGGLILGRSSAVKSTSTAVSSGASAGASTPNKAGQDKASSTDAFDAQKAVNSVIFPGIQGGPLMHVIAAKAVAFGEALEPQFKEYQTAVVQNAKNLAENLMGNGFTLVSGGTDNHLMLVDLTTFGDGTVTGKDAENWLDLAGLTVNKNTVPNEKRSPFVTSGIRIGTPAITTRGLRSNEMKWLADKITKAVASKGNPETLSKIHTEVSEVCRKFALYGVKHS